MNFSREQSLIKRITKDLGEIQVARLNLLHINKRHVIKKENEPKTVVANIS